MKPSQAAKDAGLHHKQMSIAVTRLLKGKTAENIPIKLVDWALKHTVLNEDVHSQAMSLLRKEGLDDNELVLIEGLVRQFRVSAELRSKVRAAESSASNRPPNERIEEVCFELRNAAAKMAEPQKIAVLKCVRLLESLSNFRNVPDNVAGQGDRGRSAKK